jgi:hypothetical protein
MRCKNCSSEFDSKFCPACGQKADIHRVTMGHVIHEGIHAITHADKGFILLVKELVVRPGLVAREYLGGKRKKYFNPLSFFVITTAISAYVTTKTHYFESLNKAGGSGARRMPPYMLEAFQLYNDNAKLFGLVLIAPLIAICCWLFFRKGKYNLAESFVLHAFIVGESHLIRTVIFIPIFLIFPQSVSVQQNVFQFTLLIYLMIAYRQFFKEKWWITIVKTVLLMPTYIILFWSILYGIIVLKHLSI